MDDDIATLERKRDALVRGLWLIFRDMSDTLEPEDFNHEDLVLWSVVTMHSAVQSRLSARASAIRCACIAQQRAPTPPTGTHDGD